MEYLDSKRVSDQRSQLLIYIMHKRQSQTITISSKDKQRKRKKGKRKTEKKEKRIHIYITSSFYIENHCRQNIQYLHDGRSVLP